MRHARVLRQSSSEPNRTSRSIRSGWTLIELLIAMSMTLVLAGSSTTLVIRLLKAGSTQANEVVASRSLHLWVEQLRSDARESVSARVEAAPSGDPQIILQQAAHTIVYIAHPRSIERTLDGQSAGGWALGEGRWQFSLLMEERLIRAELVPGPVETVPPPSSTPVRPPRRIVVEAALGTAATAPTGEAARE